MEKENKKDETLTSTAIRITGQNGELKINKFQSSKIYRFNFLIPVICAHFPRL